MHRNDCHREGLRDTMMLTLETPMRAAFCHLAALKARNSSWQERVGQLAT